MNHSEQYITLDLQDIALEFRIDVRVGDTMKQLVFQIADGGNPYELSEDCVVKARFKKTQTIEVTGTKKDNRVVIDVPGTVTGATGIVPCELTIEEDGDKLTTPNFNIYVWATI